MRGLGMAGCWVKFVGPRQAETPAPQEKVQHSVFWDDSHFENLWPEFAGEEDAVVDGVVGDAV